jgi:RNA polymerase sigma-70 factor, ECF subfamily
MTTNSSPDLAADLQAHGAWLLRLAKHLVRDPDQAADAVQETWIATLRQPPARDRPLRPWLSHVLRNLVRKQARGEGRRRVREEIAAGVDADSAASSEALVERVQLQQMVTRAVLALDEPFRSVLLHRYLEDRSSAEIARLMAVPEGTVRWRLKEGLDRVRAELDQQHGGARWRALLVGVLPVRVAASWKVAAAAALLVTVGIGLAVRRTSPEGSGAPPGPATTARVQLARMAGAAPAAGMHFTNGGDSVDLTGCLARLERARQAQAAVEPVYLQRAYTPSLFASGAANPAAYQALLPALEQAFDATARGPQRPALALECRTWACRLKVLQPARSPTAAWEAALTTHAALAGRILKSEVNARRPTADPLTGEALVEATVFLKLADPSGGRLATTSVAADRKGSPPATVALCQGELTRVERETSAMKATLEKDLTPEQRFHSEPADEPLTREMAARLRQAAPVARIACRGTVCEVTLPPGQTLDVEGWRSLQRHPALRERAFGLAPAGQKAYLRVLPIQVVDASATLAAATAKVAASPLLDDCYTRHPATGHLLVRYLVRAGDGRTPRPADERIQLEYSGSLLDTPLAQCVAAELARAVAAIPLPTHVMGGYHDVRYDWPRATQRRLPPNPPVTRP